MPGSQARVDTGCRDELGEYVSFSGHEEVVGVASVDNDIRAAVIDLQSSSCDVWPMDNPMN